MTSLRAWLRKSPQPARLRVRLDDDEEREIQLSADARHRWASAEQAILTMRAATVECLDATGAVIRAQMLEHEGDDDGAAAHDTARREREYDKRRAGDMRGVADVLDRYGCRMTEAFEAGSNAASQGQSQLVGLVETLATNLSISITNVHNLGMNFINTVQHVLEASGGEEGSGNKELLASVLQLAAGKMMGGPSPAQQPKPPPNGKSKPT